MTIDANLIVGFLIGFATAYLLSALFGLAIAWYYYRINKRAEES